MNIHKQLAAITFTPVAKLISDLFINMIKMVIAPVIFFTVVLGITGAGDLKKVGRVGGKGLIYFEVVTTMALFIGMLVANLVQPGRGIPPEKLSPRPQTFYHLTGRHRVEAP